MDNKQLYKITLTREQLMLISQCVEDISRFAAGDMDLQHTTDTLINDMDRAETLGIRSFIVNNSRAIRRRLFPDLEDFEHIGYDGGSKDKINRKRLIGNTYQIYRSILHQLAIDESGIMCIVISRYLQVIWEQLKWRGSTMIRRIMILDNLL